MKNSLLLLAGVVLVLNSAAAGWAQERPNGFYLASPLSLSAGYDDNFVVGSQELDDTVSILTAPTFSWIKTTRRTDFAVDYQPDFELFSRFSELNAWNHSSRLRYNYRLNPRLDFEAGNYFLSTMDATPRLAGSQFLPPRGRFKQNALFAGLKYRLAPQTKAIVRFDNAITTMALPGPANLFDQMANAGTVTLDHTVNPHHSVTGSYSYLRVRPLDRDEFVGDSTQVLHTAGAGYTHTVNRDLIIRLVGGVVRGREVAYTMGAAVEKQLGNLWIIAGYQRYLSFFGGLAPSGGVIGGAPTFANGLSPDALFQAVSLQVRGKLTRRMGLEFKGQRGRETIGNRGVRSLIAQSRLDYELNERFTLFARAEYYGQNLNRFLASPLSRRRYFGGLEITLSRPPGAEGPSGQHDISPQRSRRATDGRSPRLGGDIPDGTK